MYGTSQDKLLDTRNTFFASTYILADDECFPAYKSLASLSTGVQHLSLFKVSPLRLDPVWGYKGGILSGLAKFI